MASRPVERVLLATDPGVGVGRVPLALSEFHVPSRWPHSAGPPQALRCLSSPYELYICVLFAHMLISSRSCLPLWKPPE